MLLGAGFDCRAFRLDWPSGVRLWELDQARLAAKEAILDRAAATRGSCERHTVPSTSPTRIGQFNDPPQLLADHGWVTSRVVDPVDDGRRLDRSGGGRDEEKVAEFLAMCASTWCASTCRAGPL